MPVFNNTNVSPSDHSSFLSFFARKRLVLFVLLALFFLLLIVLWPIGANNKELSCGHVGSCWEEDDCCIVSGSGVCGGSCFCSASGSSSWYCEGEPEMAMKTGFMVPVIFLFIFILAIVIWLSCLACRDYKNEWDGVGNNSNSATQRESTTDNNDKTDGLSSSLNNPPLGFVRIEVEVPKGPMGLTMGQERGPSRGHLVDVVKDASPLVGTVQAGDELVQINDVNLTKMSERQMMETLRSLSDEPRALVLFRKAAFSTKAAEGGDDETENVQEDEVDPDV